MCVCLSVFVMVCGIFQLQNESKRVRLMRIKSWPAIFVNLSLKPDDGAHAHHPLAWALRFYRYVTHIGVDLIITNRYSFEYHLQWNL